MTHQSDPRVVAVISAFHPPLDLPERVKQLNQQVVHTVVVDDGSDLEGISPVLQELAELGCTVVRMPDNIGIAAALNAGIEAALKDWSPDFVVTLDQDSALDDGYIAAALETYAAAHAAGIDVGLVSAQSHNGLNVPLLSRRARFPQAFDPLQSGAVIPASTFKTAGLLDGRLFIDCVDSEYNLRVRSHGLATLIGKGCNMTHALGQAQPMMLFGWHVSVLGRKRHVHSHAPFRVYYMTRNNIHLWRQYGARFPVWLLRRLRFQVESDVFRLLYGANRKGQYRAFARGFVDGWLGRLGKIDPQLQRKISA
ncbi:rhamnosyltransferase [Pseudarthrobacter enclensis]|uniref:Family 2 glycosyl transferase n=1 Tax=Pseudarthrobacter enclensis TaxID=993070 RepID=A0A0V8IWF1_9MICC|nr:glycosyltransferase [Pseudarthrobacter enclensis]KSU79122.1 family 2 glycosyl transferase [Pseudarthrobacter enclensis]SCB82981.1 rhamnosyltransferase [Pseudarthrobacter enclensis]